MTSRMVTQTEGIERASVNFEELGLSTHDPPLIRFGSICLLDLNLDPSQVIYPMDRAGKKD